MILLSEELLGQNRVWDLSGWDGQFQSPEFIAIPGNLGAGEKELIDGMAPNSQIVLLKINKAGH